MLSVAFSYCYAERRGTTISVHYLNSIVSNQSIKVYQFHAQSMVVVLFVFCCLVQCRSAQCHSSKCCGAFNSHPFFQLDDSVSHSDLVYTFFHPLLRDQVSQAVWQIKKYLVIVFPQLKLFHNIVLVISSNFCTNFYLLTGSVNLLQKHLTHFLSCPSFLHLLISFTHPFY